MTKGIDYSQWKREHDSILRNLQQKEVFLLFSAGKDSSLAMHLLLKAREEYRFEFQAHAGAYPVHRYDSQEKERITSYWKEKGITPVWHAPNETDTVLENARKPCLDCQLIRKKMLRGFFSTGVKNWQNLVIINSYSLWDLVSYTLEQTLANLMLNVSEKQRLENERRRSETMQRFHPVLKMKEGYTVFRPLVKYNGSDIAHEIRKNEIPTLQAPCKYGDQRPKRVLEKYYEQLTADFDYDRLVQHVISAAWFPDKSDVTDMERDEYLGKYF